MQNPNAWLFDVDGVITNPEQKRITEPQILTEIVKRLKNGEPVALVTGRSIDFMRQRVVEPLVEKIGSRSLFRAKNHGIHAVDEENFDARKREPRPLGRGNLLQNFLAMGEKGGVWITYTQEGQPQEQIDENISVPQNLQDEVRKLIENEFSDLMFYDESKKTMISTEMIDGTNLKDYHARQKILDQKFEELVRQHGLQDRLEVDPTTIATDIQNKHVGKDFAARRVLAWLKERGVKPAQFITMGDSKSDVPMAQEIHNQGLPVTFIFVGKEADRAEIENRKLPFSVTFTQNNYEKGTLEYLSTH